MVSDSRYRQTWRLRGLMDEYLVVRGADVHTSEEKDRIAAESVLWRLRNWQRDFATERTLLDVYEALGGRRRAGLSTLERRSFLEQVWKEVEEAFQTGRLALLRLPRPVFLLPEPEKSDASFWEEKPEPTSWVGLQLEDEEGAPVAGQRVRIKLANGTVREGVSDDKGRIRMDGIPAGNCQVEFVGIDGSDWRAA
jgi:hypothetical protein